jgi:hypothetical protein
MKNKKFLIIAALVALYPAFLWIPIFIPRLERSLFFMIHLFSVALLFLGLLCLGSVALLVTIFSLIRRRPVPVFFKVCASAVAGFAVFMAIHIGVIDHLPRPLPEGSRRMAFSSEAWLSESSSMATDNDRLSIRQKMLGSVVSAVLPGKSRAEIEAYLGTSFETAHFGGAKYDMIYPLGWDRGYGIDSEWLLIWLDDRGVFKRYQIMTD